MALGACGFEAPPPDRTPPPPLPPIPLSTVSATLTVPAAELLALINEKTKSQLARADDIEVNCLIMKCRLDLVARRTGEITGRAIDSGMELNLPFDVRAELDINSKHGKTGEARALGEAHTITRLSLKPDWHLASQTQGEMHLSDAKIEIGPLRMSIAKLFNQNEEHLSQPIFRAVDKRIASAFRIRNSAERLWLKVHQPIKVGKDPQSWLLLSPERLRITPLMTRNNALIISLAADVRAKVVVGDKPATPDKPPKLPLPLLLENESNAFSVTVPATLSYANAARIAMGHLQKHPLRAGLTNVKLDKLHILPSGKDVVVAGHFCIAQKWDFTGLFDSCGDGYLRGTPKFDGPTSTLRITNLHYDTATQNLMLRIVRSIAGDELGKALEKDLVFDESRELAKLKASLRDALAKPQGRGVELTGKITGFGNPTLTWTKDGFLALFNATGTLSANLSRK